MTRFGSTAVWLLAGALAGAAPGAALAQQGPTGPNISSVRAGMPGVSYVKTKMPLFAYSSPTEQSSVIDEVGGADGAAHHRVRQRLVSHSAVARGAELHPPEPAGPGDAAALSRGAGRWPQWQMFCLRQPPWVGNQLVVQRVQPWPGAPGARA